MPTPIVVLDANVLYAIELTDLFLTFGTQRLARLHWSPTILEEVRRNLALRPDLDPRAIDYRIGRMNAALPAALDEAPAELANAMTNHPKTDTSSRSPSMSERAASSPTTSETSPTAHAVNTTSKPSAQTSSPRSSPPPTPPGSDTRSAQSPHVDASHRPPPTNSSTASPPQYPHS